MVTTLSDPRRITAAAFPADGSPTARLRYLVSYAVLASSLYNTQPWLFGIDGDTLELFADRTRALPVVDPQDRALTQSCGAALYHLRVALEHFGQGARIELLPDGDDPDLLARVRLTGRVTPVPDTERLFNAIPERRLNRRPFEALPVPPEVLAALRDAAQAEGAWFEVIEGEQQRLAVAELIAEGDRLQWDDKRFRRELAAWTHPKRSHDGLAGYALGMGPFVIRTFDFGKGRAARDRELAAGSPVLAVVGVDGDATADWLRAGQAIGRVLLRAQADGVSASYLNQPVEVEELRPKLTELIGRAGFPQLLLRMGYGPEIEPAPRRPLKEVLIEAPSWPEWHKSPDALMRQESYTPEELAELLGLSVHLVRHDAYVGKLPSYIYDHHILSIRREDALRWLSERE